jgi:predicted N-acyltransferase
LYKDQNAIAAMPLYLKTHSHGEFVFDWGWAEAYERNGLNYYPKLVSAVPFIPSTGPRIGIAVEQDRAEVFAELTQALSQRARENGISGWHLLFPEMETEEKAVLKSANVLQRNDVQFHWMNHQYNDFDNYLSKLRSSRRKNVRRERKAIAAQGVTLERKTGSGISPEDWSAFYLCYCSTYLKRSGHPGYLNRTFFDLLLEHMSDSLMLVMASRDGEPVASALFFYDSERLYGRYWGSLTDIHCLHFEACFYQGIEFCIENKIGEFDPGTQGEHKLLRGFEPVITESYHWISDVRFRDAIAVFLESEKKSTRDYGERAAEFLPFKKVNDEKGDDV